MACITLQTLGCQKVICFVTITHFRWFSPVLTEMDDLLSRIWGDVCLYVRKWDLSMTWSKLIDDMTRSSFHVVFVYQRIQWLFISLLFVESWLKKGSFQIPNPFNWWFRARTWRISTPFSCLASIPVPLKKNLV